MNTARYKDQIGFTLLEVLVAIVIISIGLLGLISLQTASLNNTVVSAAQSQATIAAQSMAARMRANMEGVRDGSYSGLSTTSISNPADCVGNKCSPEKIAKRDVFIWGQTLEQSLPSPRGSIKQLGAAGTPYEFRLTISWNAHDTGYQVNTSASSVASRCTDAAVHCRTIRVVL